MGERLKNYVTKTFQLTEEQIRNMSEAEFDKLYEEACDNEEAVACKYNGEDCEELTMAADFVDWLATI